ncbi:MAG: TonB-dependent receptor, partial [Bacteroidota bacterium]
MSLRLVLAAALCALCAAPATSQPNPTLVGRVTDAATGDPLAGAAIQGVGQAYGRTFERSTSTDSDGRYALWIEGDTLALTVSFLGYETWTSRVDVRALDSDGSTATLDVWLFPTEALLGEVEVTADEAQARLGRDVRPVAVLEGAELDDSRGATLAETIEGINGVTALTTGPSIQKPVIRGLHSDRVLVLENGVRHEGQQWGAEHAPEIDPFSGGRIEVIKGAAGVEYGAGAIGGVVRIEEEDLPTESGLGGRLSLQTFTNSAQGAGSLLLEGAPSGLPGFAWRAQGSLRRAGDARTPDFVVRNSSFAEASGHLTLGYRRGPFEIDGHLRRYATDLGIYRGAHFGNVRNLEAIIERGGPNPNWNYEFSYDIAAPKQSITHDVASLDAHTTFGDGHHVDATYSVQRNDRQEFDAHGRLGDDNRNEPRAAFDVALLTQTLDLKVEPNVSDRARLVVGTQARTQLNENGESGFLIPNFRAYDGGLFAHGSFAATSALTIDAGLRLDGRTQRAFPRNRGTRQIDPVRRTWVGGSAVVGGLLALAPTWSVAANVGSAWRPPNISELYSFGVHHGTALFEIGDPDLSVERSLDASATLRHESGFASAEVSGYVNHVFGYVYALEQPEPSITIRGSFPTFLTEQADARLAGVDATVELRPQSWLSLGAR